MRISSRKVIVLFVFLTLGNMPGNLLMGRADQRRLPLRLLRARPADLLVSQASSPLSSRWLAVEGRSQGIRAKALSSQPQALPADANWSDVFRFPGPGFNRPVSALALDTSGQLYAGGDFTEAGGPRLNGIAKWNGSSWSPLGTGISGAVFSLLSRPGGNLIVGGSFQNAGGVPVNNVALWNGAGWSPLGAGLNGLIGALAVHPNGSVFAAGWLWEGEGNRIARWDGSAWSFLPGGFDGDVLALAVDPAGNLYVGGAFTAVGSVTANGIAKWNGANWSSPGNGFAGSVRALAFDPAGNLFAGGDFLSTGVTSVNFVARWNGTTWTGLGNGVSGPVYALAFDSQGSAYAAGDMTSVMKWNGQAWLAAGQVFNGPVSALIGRGDTVYAGGSFSDIGSSRVNFAAQFASGLWSPVGAGRPGCGADGQIEAMIIDKSGNVYVDGMGIAGAGGVSTTDRGVLRWDGKTWAAIGLPGTVYAFAVDAANRVYAAGEFAQGTYRIARWDGASWSYVPGTFDYLITCLAVDAAGNLYAGGDFGQVNGGIFNSIAKWNGSSWSTLGTGVLGSVFALAADSTGNVYVGGYFSTAGGVNAQNIAKWNGTGWSALSSGIDGFISALACDSAGRLYAGGLFSSAGGVDVSGIARWDGTGWSGLAGGVRLDGDFGSVEALALDAAGTLYVTGAFNQAGATPANNIAKWNGTTWSGMGSGLGGPGFAIDCSPAGDLYVGGDFVEAGGKSSSYIAEWSQSSPTVMPLNQGRFKAEIVWRASGISGAAQPVALSSDSGYFWFFGPTNLEILVKVLDGRGVNGHFWVFFGALTDVQFDLVITDTLTGAVRTYSNPAGVQAGRNDTVAFSDSGSPSAGVPDLEQETRAFNLVLELARREGFASPLSSAPQSALQLHNGRFTIEVQWLTPSGATGTAAGVPLTTDSGLFWFFSASNIELATKILDARGVNGHFWFFYGALTDLNYNIRVTDTTTGIVKLYQGEQGKQKSGYDLAAF